MTEWINKRKREVLSRLKGQSEINSGHIPVSPICRNSWQCQFMAKCRKVNLAHQKLCTSQTCVSKALRFEDYIHHRWQIPIRLWEGQFKLPFQMYHSAIHVSNFCPIKVANQITAIIPEEWDSSISQITLQSAKHL